MTLKVNRNCIVYSAFFSSDNWAFLLKIARGELRNYSVGYPLE